MRSEVSRLIAASYSEDVAQAFMHFTPGAEALSHFQEFGLDILAHIPKAPGACVLMSAVWTARVRDNTSLPVHQVVGILEVDGHRVFGEETETDIASTFTQSNLDWNGHSWVVFGDRIGDISIFRTAYDDAAPKRLKQAIVREFGTGRGVLIATPAELAKVGLDYIPQFVVSDDQITALFRGAKKFFLG